MLDLAARVGVRKTAVVDLILLLVPTISVDLRNLHALRSGCLALDALFFVLNIPLGGSPVDGP